MTLCFFLFNQVAFANPVGAGIELAAPREVPGFLAIDIPAELATLDDLYEAPPSPDPRLVLHIQNAHANYGAQQKIRDLLAHLHAAYGINTIFVEGATETLDPGSLRYFPDAERNRKFADILAKQGELTGAELFVLENNGVTGPGPRATNGLNAQNQIVGRVPENVSRSGDGAAVTAYGIEDTTLYRANYEALKQVFESEAIVERYLGGVESRLETLSSKAAGPELRRLLAEWQKFERGSRDFMPYVKQLAADAKRILGLDLESLFSQVEWPQITRLLVLQQMEQSLAKQTTGHDQRDTAHEKAEGQAVARGPWPVAQNAELEKNKLIHWLREKRLPDDLIRAVENFKDQRINITRGNARGASEAVQPRYLLERLAREAGPRGFRFSDHPAFSLYAGYLVLKSELDSKSLFAELDRLFREVLDKIAVTDAQKELLALWRDTVLVRKLLALELTRADWNEAAARKDGLAVGPLVERLQKLGKTVNAAMKLSDTPFETRPMNPKFRERVSSLYDAAWKFYDYAREREAVFYEKLSAVMDEKGERKAVLITGGFHTDGISGILREHEVSYGILTPRLMEKSDEKAYRNLMLQEQELPFGISNLEAIIKLQKLSAQFGQGAVPRWLLGRRLKALMEAGNFSLEQAVEFMNAFFAARIEQGLDTGGIEKLESAGTNGRGMPVYRIVPRSETRTSTPQPKTTPGVTPGVVLGQGFEELTGRIDSALLRYANVHRGAGQHSIASTELFEEARHIVLRNLGMNDQEDVVIFCTDRTLGLLQDQIQGGEASYKVLSSRDLGLPLGVTALGVKRAALPGGIPVNVGGGTIRMVSKNFVVWADAPDRFEPGTPNIMGVITFAIALNMIQAAGDPGLFNGPKESASSVDSILNQDDLGDLTGEALLREVQKTFIGPGAPVPTAEGEKPFINFDNGASTPAFAAVRDVFIRVLSQPPEMWPALLEASREIVAGFLNAPAGTYDVLFTANTTEGTNIASETLEGLFQDAKETPDEEPVIMTTLIEHNSNFLPWKFIGRRVPGASSVMFDTDTDGFIDPEQFRRTLEDYNQRSQHGKKRIRLVAVSGASNVLGSYNNIAELARIAHENGARILVDAAQLASHRKIDMARDGIDFLALSGHKMNAPFGAGALVIRKEILGKMDPERVRQIRESGERNVAGIAAMAKVMQVLGRIGMDVVEAEEHRLTTRILEELSKIKGVRIFGVQPGSPRINDKGGVVAISIDGVPHNWAAKRLSEYGGIGVRSGCFCANPLVLRLLGRGPVSSAMAHLGMMFFPKLMGPFLIGLVRISSGISNTDAEIETMARVVRNIAEGKYERVELFNRFLGWAKFGTPSVGATPATEAVREFADRLKEEVYGSGLRAEARADQLSEETKARLKAEMAARREKTLEQLRGNFPADKLAPEIGPEAKVEADRLPHEKEEGGRRSFVVNGREIPYRDHGGAARIYIEPRPAGREQAGVFFKVLYPSGTTVDRFIRESWSGTPVDNPDARAVAFYTVVDEDIENFIYEARSIQQVNPDGANPHLPHLLRIGMLSDGRVYAEYSGLPHAADASAANLRGANLTLRQRVTLIALIARALVDVHKHGVHGDIHPRNFVWSLSNVGALAAMLIDFNAIRTIDGKHILIGMTAPYIQERDYEVFDPGSGEVRPVANFGTDLAMLGRSLVQVILGLDENDATLEYYFTDPQALGRLAAEMSQLRPGAETRPEIVPFLRIAQNLIDHDYEGEGRANAAAKVAADLEAALSAAEPGALDKQYKTVDVPARCVPELEALRASVAALPEKPVAPYKVVYVGSNERNYPEALRDLAADRRPPEPGAVIVGTSGLQVYDFACARFKPHGQLPEVIVMEANPDMVRLHELARKVIDLSETKEDFRREFGKALAAQPWWASEEEKARSVSDLDNLEWLRDDAKFRYVKLLLVGGKSLALHADLTSAAAAGAVADWLRANDRTVDGMYIANAAEDFWARRGKGGLPGLQDLVRRLRPRTLLESHPVPGELSESPALSFHPEVDESVIAVLGYMPGPSRGETQIRAGVSIPAPAVRPPELLEDILLGAELPAGIRPDALLARVWKMPAGGLVTQYLVRNAEGEESVALEVLGRHAQLTRGSGYAQDNPQYVIATQDQKSLTVTFDAQIEQLVSVDDPQNIQYRAEARADDFLNLSTAGLRGQTLSRPAQTPMIENEIPLQALLPKVVSDRGAKMFARVWKMPDGNAVTQYLIQRAASQPPEVFVEMQGRQDPVQDRLGRTDDAQRNVQYTMVTDRGSLMVKFDPALSQVLRVFDPQKIQYLPAAPGARAEVRDVASATGGAQAGVPPEPTGLMGAYQRLLEEPGFERAVRNLFISPGASLNVDAIRRIGEIDWRRYGSLPGLDLAADLMDGFDEGGADAEVIAAEIVGGKAVLETYEELMTAIGPEIEDASPAVRQVIRMTALIESKSLAFREDKTKEMAAAAGRLIEAASRYQAAEEQYTAGVDGQRIPVLTSTGTETEVLRHNHGPEFRRLVPGLKYLWKKLGCRLGMDPTIEYTFAPANSHVVARAQQDLLKSLGFVPAGQALSMHVNTVFSGKVPLAPARAAMGMIMLTNALLFTDVERIKYFMGLWKPLDEKRDGMESTGRDSLIGGSDFRIEYRLADNTDPETIRFIQAMHGALKKSVEALARLQFAEDGSVTRYEFELARLLDEFVREVQKFSQREPLAAQLIGEDFFEKSTREMGERMVRLKQERAGQLAALREKILRLVGSIQGLAESEAARSQEGLEPVNADDFRAIPFIAELSGKMTAKTSKAILATSFIENRFDPAVLLNTSPDRRDREIYFRATADYSRFMDLDLTREFRRIFDIRAPQFQIQTLDLNRAIFSELFRMFDRARIPWWQRMLGPFGNWAAWALSMFAGLFNPVIYLINTLPMLSAAFHLQATLWKLLTVRTRIAFQSENGTWFRNRSRIELTLGDGADARRINVRVDRSGRVRVVDEAGRQEVAILGDGQRLMVNEALGTSGEKTSPDYAEISRRDVPGWRGFLGLFKPRVMNFTVTPTLERKVQVLLSSPQVRQAVRSGDLPPAARAEVRAAAGDGRQAGAAAPWAGILPQDQFLFPARRSGDGQYEVTVTGPEDLLFVLNVWNSARNGYERVTEPGTTFPSRDGRPPSVIHSIKLKEGQVISDAHPLKLQVIIPPRAEARIMEPLAGIEERYPVILRGSRQGLYVAGNDVGLDEVPFGTVAAPGEGSVFLGVSGLSIWDVAVRRYGSSGILPYVIATDIDPGMSEIHGAVRANIAGYTREQMRRAIKDLIERRVSSMARAFRDALGPDYADRTLNKLKWLNHDADYEFVRKVVANGRFASLNADLRNPGAMAELDQWMAANGLHLDLMYLSNAWDETWIDFGLPRGQKGAPSMRSSLVRLAPDLLLVSEKPEPGQWPVLSLTMLDEFLPRLGVPESVPRAESRVDADFLKTVAASVQLLLTASAISGKSWTWGELHAGLAEMIEAMPDRPPTDRYKDQMRQMTLAEFSMWLTGREISDANESIPQDGIVSLTANAGMIPRIIQEIENGIRTVGGVAQYRNNLIGAIAFLALTSGTEDRGQEQALLELLSRTFNMTRAEARADALEAVRASLAPAVLDWFEGNAGAMQGMGFAPGDAGVGQYLDTGFLAKTWAPESYRIFRAKGRRIATESDLMKNLVFWELGTNVDDLSAELAPKDSVYRFLVGSGTPGGEPDKRIRSYVAARPVSLEGNEGVEIVYADDGPGIPDLRWFLTEGATTHRGGHRGKGGPAIADAVTSGGIFPGGASYGKGFLIIETPREKALVSPYAPKENDWSDYHDLPAGGLRKGTVFRIFRFQDPVTEEQMKRVVDAAASRAEARQDGELSPPQRIRALGQEWKQFRRSIADAADNAPDLVEAKRLSGVLTELESASKDYQLGYSARNQLRYLKRQLQGIEDRAERSRELLRTAGAAELLAVVVTEPGTVQLDMIIWRYAQLAGSSGELLDMMFALKKVDEYYLAQKLYYLARDQFDPEKAGQPFRAFIAKRFRDAQGSLSRPSDSLESVLQNLTGLSIEQVDQMSYEQQERALKGAATFFREKHGCELHFYRFGEVLTGELREEADDLVPFARDKSLRALRVAVEIDRALSVFTYVFTGLNPDLRHIIIDGSRRGMHGTSNGYMRIPVEHSNVAHVMWHESGHAGDVDDIVAGSLVDIDADIFGRVDPDKLDDLARRYYQSRKENDPEFKGPGPEVKGTELAARLIKDIHAELQDEWKIFVRQADYYESQYRGRRMWGKVNRMESLILDWLQEIPRLTRAVDRFYRREDFTFGLLKSSVSPGKSTGDLIADHYLGRINARLYHALFDPWRQYEVSEDKAKEELLSESGYMPTQFGFRRMLQWWNKDEDEIAGIGAGSAAFNHRYALWIPDYGNDRRIYARVNDTYHPFLRASTHEVVAEALRALLQDPASLYRTHPALYELTSLIYGPLFEEGNETVARARNFVPEPAMDVRSDSAEHPARYLRPDLAARLLEVIEKTGQAPSFKQDSALKTDLRKAINEPLEFRDERLPYLDEMKDLFGSRAEARNGMPLPVAGTKVPMAPGMPTTVREGGASDAGRTLLLPSVLANRPGFKGTFSVVQPTTRTGPMTGTPTQYIIEVFEIGLAADSKAARDIEAYLRTHPEVELVLLDENEIRPGSEVTLGDGDGVPGNLKGKTVEISGLSRFMLPDAEPNGIDPAGLPSGDFRYSVTDLLRVKIGSRYLFAVNANRAQGGKTVLVPISEVESFSDEKGKALYDGILESEDDREPLAMRGTVRAGNGEAFVRKYAAGEGRVIAAYSAFIRKLFFEFYVLRDLPPEVRQGMSYYAEKGLPVMRPYTLDELRKARIQGDILSLMQPFLSGENGGAVGRILFALLTLRFDDGAQTNDISREIRQFRLGAEQIARIREIAGVVGMFSLPVDIVTAEAASPSASATFKAAVAEAVKPEYDAYREKAELEKSRPFGLGNLFPDLAPDVLELIKAWTQDQGVRAETRGGLEFLKAAGRRLEAAGREVYGLLFPGRTPSSGGPAATGAVLSVAAPLLLQKFFLDVGLMAGAAAVIALVLAGIWGVVNAGGDREFHSVYDVMDSQDDAAEGKRRTVSGRDQFIGTLFTFAFAFSAIVIGWAAVNAASLVLAQAIAAVPLAVTAALWFVWNGKRTEHYRVSREYVSEQAGKVLEDRMWGAVRKRLIDGTRVRIAVGAAGEVGDMPVRVAYTSQKQLGADAQGGERTAARELLEKQFGDRFMILDLGTREEPVYPKDDKGRPLTKKPVRGYAYAHSFNMTPLTPLSGKIKGARREIGEIREALAKQDFVKNPKKLEPVLKAFEGLASRMSALSAAVVANMEKMKPGKLESVKKETALLLSEYAMLIAAGFEVNGVRETLAKLTAGRENLDAGMTRALPAAWDPAGPAAALNTLVSRLGGSKTKGVREVAAGIPARVQELESSVPRAEVRVDEMPRSKMGSLDDALASVGKYRKTFEAAKTHAKQAQDTYNSGVGKLKGSEEDQAQQLAELRKRLDAAVEANDAAGEKFLKMISYYEQGILRGKIDGVVPQAIRGADFVKAFDAGLFHEDATVEIELEDGSLVRSNAKPLSIKRDEGIYLVDARRIVQRKDIQRVAIISCPNLMSIERNDRLLRGTHADKAQHFVDWWLFVMNEEGVAQENLDKVVNALLASGATVDGAAPTPKQMAADMINVMGPMYEPFVRTYRGVFDNDVVRELLDRNQDNEDIDRFLNRHEYGALGDEVAAALAAAYFYDRALELRDALRRRAEVRQAPAGPELAAGMGRAMLSVMVGGVKEQLGARLADGPEIDFNEERGELTLRTPGKGVVVVSGLREIRIEGDGFWITHTDSATGEPRTDRVPFELPFSVDKPMTLAQYRAIETAWRLQEVARGPEAPEGLRLSWAGVSGRMTPAVRDMLTRTRFSQITELGVSGIEDAALQVAFLVHGILDLQAVGNEVEAAERLTKLAVALGADVMGAVAKAIEGTVLSMSNDPGREGKFVADPGLARRIAENVKWMLLLNPNYRCVIVMPDAYAAEAREIEAVVKKWADALNVAGLSIGDRFRALPVAQFNRMPGVKGTVFSVSEADRAGVFAGKISFSKLAQHSLVVETHYEFTDPNMAAANAAFVKLSQNVARSGLKTFAIVTPEMLELIRNLPFSADAGQGVRITDQTLSAYVQAVFQAVQALQQIQTAA